MIIFKRFWVTQM